MNGVALSVVLCKNCIQHCTLYVMIRVTNCIFQIHTKIIYLYDLSRCKEGGEGRGEVENWLKGVSVRTSNACGPALTRSA